MISSIVDLRENLSDILEGVKNGTIGYHEASEMNNAAGKMINSAKVQIEYFHMIGTPKKIKFLEEKK